MQLKCRNEKEFYQLKWASLTNIGRSEVKSEAYSISNWNLENEVKSKAYDLCKKMESRNEVKSKPTDNIA